MDSYMTKSHFVLEKQYPVNRKKNVKSYTILALVIYLCIHDNHLRNRLNY
jgi:hypothetical protein